MTVARRAVRFLFLITAFLLGAVAQAASPAQVKDFFRAVQLDDPKTVQAMLGTVNPNEQNPLGGEPALVLAVREGSMRVFDVLLAYPGTDLEAQALNGNTALMMAAFKHNKPAVIALLNKGAAINRAGWSALHYAAASGDDEIAGILLKRGASVDATSPPGTGLFTPLMMAAREGHDSTAALLVEQGANPSLKNSEGLTATQIATRAGKQAAADASKGAAGSR
jgi:ankyrin repeat protein